MTTHAISFDVENWYDSNLHKGALPGPEDRRVCGETEHVLGLLDQHGVKATFFVLGEVADRHPQLVRAMAAGGHEVACHSWDHRLIWQQKPEAVYAKLARAHVLLQDISGQPVLGFRAPSWSINRQALAWMPDLLARVGFAYDSSIFPLRTPLYGVSGAPRTPWYHRLSDGSQFPEIPPAVAGGLRGLLKVPFGGGLYWRVLPQGVIRRMVAAATSPVVLYVHPWELNPAGVPLGKGAGLAERFAASVGMSRNEATFTMILRSFALGPMRDVFNRWIARGG